MDLTICCADIGSVEQGTFGWALRDLPGPLLEVPGHASITELADEIATRLANGRSVALGFECPLFVPVRDVPEKLTSARKGEGSRAWSAGAGCGALSTGLVESVWLLSRLREVLTDPPLLTLSWTEFLDTPGSLFLWEAFVTREAKTNSHHGDAGVAVEAFCRALPNPVAANAVDEERVFSLIGAAALRAGWDVPISILAEPCVVIAG